MSMRLFVSYRRSDSPYAAGRLREALVAAVGDENVFFDVDSIEFGSDIGNRIRETLAEVDAVVVVVGRGLDTRRLFDTGDFVRLELLEAFAQGKRVVPVLVDGAVMPESNQLPAELRELPLLNAAQLRPDPDFRHDVERLIASLHRSLTEPRRPRASQEETLIGRGVSLPTVRDEVVPEDDPSASDVSSTNVTGRSRAIFGGGRISDDAMLLILGQVDHGKTTLMAAIAQSVPNGIPADGKSLKSFEHPPSVESRGIAVPVARWGFVTGSRRFTLFDLPGPSDHTRGLISGAVQADAAILVIAANDGPMRQTREHLALARDVGLRSLVVVLNKSDLDGDPLLEAEVRELLSAYGFPGSEVPVVRLSALRTLKRDPAWEPSLRELMRALALHVPEPRRPRDEPFVMPIEDAFEIAGRGPVVVGRIERGSVAQGDNVEIVGADAARLASCAGVEMFGKVVSEGSAGDSIGVLLAGIPMDAVRRGQVLSQPGSVRSHTEFFAQVYCLTHAEGGRRAQWPSSYQPQLMLWAAGVAGAVQVPSGARAPKPGDTVLVSVRLETPVALEHGLRFTVREDGRTVGVGFVTSFVN